MLDGCFVCLLEKKGTTFKVIDNPISAVRELIENSIKAYSRTIKIKLDALSGGYKYIQICDDGLGIEKSKRHQVFLQEKLTTTKGRSIRRKSLFKIGNTALKHGSIEVCTRTSLDKTAHQWDIAKSSIQNGIKFRNVVYHRGTKIIIRNLHESKKANEIQGLNVDIIQKIRDIMCHFSLLHNKISFNLDLVHLLEDGSVLIQKKLPPLFHYDDRYHHFTNIMKGFGNGSLFRCINNLACGKDFSASVIFPDILTQEPLVTKGSHRYPCINNTIQAAESKFGQRAIRFFTELYNEFNKPGPNFWFLQINCHHPQVRILFGEKNRMTNGINVDSILLTLRQKILELYKLDKPGSKLVTKEFSDVHTPDLIDSFPDRACEGDNVVKDCEQDWVTDMCDFQEIRSKNIGHGGVIYDLTNELSDDEVETDDLVLSKTVSLSNPFILSRFRSRNVTASQKNQGCGSETVLDIPLISSRPFSSVSNDTCDNEHNKKRKLLDNSFSFEGDSTTLVDIEEKTDAIQPRSLQSFYEGTKNLKVYRKLEHKDYTIRNLFKTSYKKELIWCYRKGMPSLTLIDGIQEKMEQLDSNVDIQLSLLENGWFLISI